MKVSCCYLEIYNEEIRDLLQPGGWESVGVRLSGLEWSVGLLRAEDIVVAFVVFFCF